MRRALVAFGALVFCGLPAHPQGRVPARDYGTQASDPRMRAVHNPSILAGGTPSPSATPANSGPLIASYSPGFGAPGTLLKITGTGFGPPSSGSSVSVLSAVTNTWTKWPPISWSDSEVDLSVPGDMPIGKVYLVVTVEQAKSNGTYPFTVGIPPNIVSYSPTSGSRGTDVTINGHGFGTPADGNTLETLSNGSNTLAQWTIKSWKDSEIVATIPASMPLGKVSLIVHSYGLDSIGTYPFTVGNPPTIASYSPTSGPVGTSLTIIGDGFGVAKSSSAVNVVSAVTGARTSWTATKWTDSEIDVSVPSTMSSGKVYLSVSIDALESIGTYPFTVGTPPVILGSSPQSGPPGATLTINGYGFGSSAANGKLSINSAGTGAWTTWTPTSWSDNTIVATVPRNFPTGKIYLSVTVNDLTDVGTYPFYVGVPPAFKSYSPDFGLPGTVITINGTGFGKPSEYSYFYVISAVDNTEKWWKTDSWTDTQIVVTVPENWPLGKVYLVAWVGGLESLGWNAFTVGVPPSISSYAPSSGPVGTELVINGSGFGSEQGDSYVSVETPTEVYTIWPATSWSDKQIVVPVPSNVPLGKVYIWVTVNQLRSITSNPFTVGVPPQISNYSPGYGLPGTLLTISGKGFGVPSPSSSLNVISSVTGDRTTWPAVVWGDSEIVAAVPSGAALGKVYLSVTVNGLESIGTYPFTVGVPPSIASYTPGFGAPGTVLTVKGTGFGQPTADSYFYVDSTVTGAESIWPATSWSDSQIVVTVPSDMPQGKAYIGVSVNQLRSVETSPFTVGIPPSIANYSPQSGPAGTVLTITGTGFGPNQTDSTVYVNFPATGAWIQWTPTSWSDTQILVSVPQVSATGRYYLFMTVGGLQTIGTYPFDLR